MRGRGPVGAPTVAVTGQLPADRGRRPSQTARNGEDRLTPSTTQSDLFSLTKGQVTPLQVTPAAGPAIHSSRRRRNVVAEQRRSAWRRYPAPKTRTLISSSKTIRSQIRGRLQPNGCWSRRAGNRAVNCSQMGSIRHGGKAGT